MFQNVRVKNDDCLYVLTISIFILTFPLYYKLTMRIVNIVQKENCSLQIVVPQNVLGFSIEKIYWIEIYAKIFIQRLKMQQTFGDQKFAMSAS